MRIVVIGGSGLIGSRLVGLLRQGGHDVVAASPSSGVNTVSGDGLPEAMEGTDVVVDVANSPSFDSAVAWDFFFASGNNLFATETAAGVKHHVALSVVGTDRLLDSGYFRAKLLQEDSCASRAFPTPSCARPSSSSSCAASPARAWTARSCACRPLSRSRSPPTMSPRLSPSPPCVHPSTVLSRSPDPSPIA